MPPERQVCSLELANLLQELGVKQESLFYWWKGEHPDDKFILINPVLDNRTSQAYRDGYPNAEMYAAFTVAELGEMLPSEYRSYRVAGGMWFCAARPIGTYIPLLENADTEANVRASMLIYLLENKLTKK